MNLREIQEKHKQLIETMAEDISTVFGKYYSDVVSFLMGSMTDDEEINLKYTEGYILSVIGKMREELEAQIQEEVDQKLEEAFILGFLFFMETTGLEAAESFYGSTVKQKTEDTIRQAINNAEYSVRKLVKSVYAENLLKSTLTEQSAKSFVPTFNRTKFEQYLDKEGFTGIIDKANRRWKADVYAKMVLRTKAMESLVEIQKEQGRNHGIDLAYIAGVPVDNPCNNWIGVVISLNGLTTGFTTYEQAKETGEIFHPNCQHYLVPIRSIEQAPDWVVSATNRKYGLTPEKRK